PPSLLQLRSLLRLRSRRLLRCGLCGGAVLIGIRVFERGGAVAVNDYARTVNVLVDPTSILGFQAPCQSTFGLDCELSELVAVQIVLDNGPVWFNDLLHYSFFVCRGVDEDFGAVSRTSYVRDELLSVVLVANAHQPMTRL